MREELDFLPWNKVDPFTGLAYPPERYNLATHLFNISTAYI